MTTSERKKIIRDFIRAQWDDDKLAEVEKFCRAGKMSPINSCCCLLGVTLAKVHDRRCDDYYKMAVEGGPYLTHYGRARVLPGGTEAENAYMSFGLVAADTYLLQVITTEKRRRAAKARRDKMVMEKNTHALQIPKAYATVGCMSSL